VLTKTKPTDQQLADYRASKIRRLKIQTGLDRAALLPEHTRLLEELADAFAGGLGTSRPLHAVKEAELTKVRGTLLLLPRTIEIERYLTATVDGPIRHRI
jgi:hypothetical protein